MKIKTNDKIKMLNGKDAGKVGKVIQTFPKDNKIVVEGVNVIKKHLRARGKSEKGQIIELAAPFNVAKAILLCSKCEKAVRVSYKTDGDKKKRFCKACGQFID